MLFVNILRATGTVASMLPEQRMKLMMANQEYTEKYMKMGKFKSLYASLDLKTFVVIWEADSAEEAARIFAEAPLARYMDTENLPVIEYESYRKIMDAAMMAAVK
jgi:hypothetical protein